MKKRFYIKLFNGLNLNGDAFVVSIIKGNYIEPEELINEFRVKSQEIIDTYK